MVETLEMTPLERAAAVLEREVGSHCANCETPIPYEPRDLARAVLQAIREPSGDLLECIHGRSTVTDWKAMIDAALEEG